MKDKDENDIWTNEKAGDIDEEIKTYRRNNIFQLEWWKISRHSHDEPTRRPTVTPSNQPESEDGETFHSSKENPISEITSLKIWQILMKINYSWK